MEGDFEKPVMISPHMEDYESFFDHEWAKQFDALVTNDNLREVSFDLLVTWKGVANCYRMPWMIPHLAQAFYDGHMKDGFFAADLVERMRSELVGRMRDNLDGPARGKLRRILAEMTNAVKATRAQSATFDVKNNMWNAISSKDELRVGLWATQRLAYGAVYFAYEDFLIRCIKMLKGVDSWRIPPKTKEFRAEFTGLYNAQLFDTCWTDQGVQLGRLVRHALVHNGGRLTPELRAKQRWLTVQNNEIQVLAQDTRGLFNHLKERASALAKETQARL